MTKLHSPSIARFRADLLTQAAAVKVVFLDVDGVLTDGSLWFSDAGETMKRFNTLDGHGLKLLQRAGITPAVVTGRDSAALRNRLSALGVVHARFGTEDKLPAANELLAELGLSWAQAAAMGDDWPDLPMLTRAALACVPATAQADVLAHAHFTPHASAGNGAVRELCDLLLHATGQYDQLLQDALQ
ncbi:HAD hydrolase family protein [Comamonadaceae bacterium M7527]|nr:HAD hydrolase family protein [Comamonadaceae bacterium M7527]